MISVGCVREGDKVVAAGGYIVQLLPELSEGLLMVMTERLAEFVSVDSFISQKNASPEALLSELLYGMPYKTLEETPITFQCQCSAVRVLTGFASLPRSELQELVESREALDITCEYCGQHYAVGPDQLRGLLDRS